MLLLPDLVSTGARMLGISPRELKLLVCTNSPSPTPDPSGPFRPYALAGLRACALDAPLVPVS